MADCSQLSKNITQIAMNIASRNPNIDNIDGVLEQIKKHFPTLNRQMLVDAIVEASTRETKQTDETIKRLAKIRNEAKSDRTLKQRIAELEQYLRTGQIPQKNAKIKDVPDAIKQLREIREQLKKQLNQSEPAVKERLQKSIDYLQKKIDTGDIMPKTRQETPQSKEIERLQYEKDMLAKKIRHAIINLKPKSVWEWIAEPFNTARALMTSFEFSGVLRQGGFIAFGNPVRAAKSIIPMFKAFGSERLSNKINKDILNRDNAPLYAKSGLYLAPVDSVKLSGKEEAYMSKWAEKIPGIRASERAYITFLNKLRADSFDAMIESFTKNGKPTIKEAKAIAKFVNIATGRGDLGALETASVPLNTLFFAPRYTASRFQLLVGSPLWSGTAKTRYLIAKEYAKYFMGLGLVYLLAKMAGAEVEEDPRSSDFGKIRFGNTRIDILSGLGQTTVISARLITGQTKTGKGKINDIRGDKLKYGQDDSYKVATRFLRTKLSPMFGTAVDLMTGKNVVGEKVTATSAALNLSIPITYRDIYDVMIEKGVPTGSALSLLAIFGAGLQTYEPKKKK